MAHHMYFNQQGFAGLASNNSLVQDGSGQYNFNKNYPSIGNSYHPPHFYPIPALKSEYGDVGVSGASECAPPMLNMPWNHLPQLDHLNQMAMHGSGYHGRDQSPNLDEINRNQPREKAPESVRKTQSPKSSTVTNVSCHTQNWIPTTPPLWQPASNAKATSPAMHLSNAPDVNFNSPPQSQNLYSSKQNSPLVKEEGAWTQENTRCSSTSSASSTVTSSTPTSVSRGTADALDSDSEDEVPTTAQMEEFAKVLKHKRITMGFTQADVGIGLGVLFDKNFSQTTICRFESLQLSFKNMCKLKPLLETWLLEVERLDNPQDLINRAQKYALANKRKNRTSIDAVAKRNLESYFVRCPKPSALEIAQISREFNLEKDVTRIWFCNRRQKERRHTQHMMRGPGGENNQLVSSSTGNFTYSQMVPPPGFSTPSMGFLPTYHQNEVFSQQMLQGMPVGNHFG
ncbi:POU domain, class 5, transcription factor 1.2-like [Spea bombifrons]|uniref:POU domain, class 5, transcription factor 1.2-like n=1 Tax=Spea bombifrons TaxID=233779 RepID=UPI00234AFEF2|nr:POU domain, class 5, transcription factor 1.2-like [Spea bombifrons]